MKSHINGKFRSSYLILSCSLIPFFTPNLLSAGARWVGRTKEVFTKQGLGRLRIFEPARPVVVSLDLDMDGDLDLLRLPRGRRSTLECFLRGPDGNFSRKGRVDLSYLESSKVRSVKAALLGPARRPFLVVQLQGPPYLVVLPQRRPGFFEGPVDLRRFFPGPFYTRSQRAEPYLKLCSVLNWNGDGYQDLLVELKDSKLQGKGEVIRRHGLFVLYGSERFPEGKAREVLDLLRLGGSVRVLLCKDFDGDGTVELLLYVEKWRTQSILTREVLFLRKSQKIVQVASWNVGEGIGQFFSHDLTADGIEDPIFCLPRSGQLLLLLSRRSSRTGFVFSPKRLSPGPKGIPPEDSEIFLGFSDFDSDGFKDILCAASDHNQVQMFLGAGKALLFFLPLLPRAPRKNSWFRKVMWFGDADGKEGQELLIVTNQPLNSDYMPPSDLIPEGPKAAILPIVRKGDEANRYAPYYRLLVYRPTPSKITLNAVYNTMLSASSYTPTQIMFSDINLDGKKELVIECRSEQGQKEAQAVFELSPPFPSKPIAEASPLSSNSNANAH